MGKLEVIDGKQTNWGGLWYHPEYCGFSSQAINIAQLKKFKGNVRLYVRKNKFFSRNEDNNRPNYCFCLKDANSDTFTELSVNEEEKYIKYDGYCYCDEEGNRLYTRDEVQHAINCAAKDGERGYSGYGDNLVEDYI